MVSRAARTLLVGTLSLIAAAALFFATGNRFVVTPSIPVGWWRLETVPATIARGETVVVCLPQQLARLGLARGYVGHGNCAGGTVPYAKVVVAIGGDEVQLSGVTMTVGSREVPCGKRAARDGRGRPLFALRDGRYRIGAGEVWLCGSSGSAAWDSRYFGPLPSRAVFGLIRPVWVDSYGAIAYNKLVIASAFRPE